MKSPILSEQHQKLIQPTTRVVIMKYNVMKMESGSYASELKKSVITLDYVEEFLIETDISSLYSSWICSNQL